MEAEALTISDNTVIDPSPECNFPKPDFTEIIQDHLDTPSDKIETPVFKPTFKSALQAKKRLQAFSSARSGSLPSSPKKVKPNENEKADDAKKTPKKGATHDDKAKAVIEEIEELKREELAAVLEHQRHVFKRSRSRSRSLDKGRFKKVDKKSRNYRRKSTSPKKVREKSPKKRESPKKVKKYPKNWREFYENDATYEMIREFGVSTPTGNNDVLKQVVFESPALPIVPFKMKGVNREEKIVPFEYVRYTRTKPVVAYSVNFSAIKEVFLPRKMILDSLPKDIVANIEKLYSNSLKFAEVKTDPSVKKSKNWYSRSWKNSENECKIIEKSVGLSFLQTYTGEEEESEFVEEIRPERVKEKHKEKVKEKEEKVKEEEKEIEKDEKVEKKPKKAKKDDAEKKKKKKRKMKKKNADENSEQTSKKKKRNKEKKKVKRAKDKKHKTKKSKEKKKKEKDEKAPERIEKLSKEQVIEELKEIEEKLAKRREEEKAKKLEKEEKTRKRKHSDHEEDAKSPKHSKTSEESVEEKEEHALKRKLEKAKKQELQNDEKKTEVKKEEVKKSESEEKVIPKRKSRWSDAVIKQEPEVKNEEKKETEDLNNDEENKETTPDTDEYHSHWESDDDVSSSVHRRSSLKLNRSWESDEELFERSQNNIKKPAETYSNLEIPLNIKTFSRRSANEEKPFSVIEELKLLEEERRSLSEERKKLELEKQKIIKLQEEAKQEQEDKKEAKPEVVKVKKEKCEINDFNIDSLNNSLLSNVSSTESNFPIAALENEYEEFIKAVSSESSAASKKKPERRSSSSSSNSRSNESDHKKRKRKAKLKKKKKKKKRECEGLLVGKGNDIFNEFDIPVPSDLPEMVPTPVPVPSPVILEKILPLTTPNLLLNSIIEPPEKTEEPKPENLTITKPFVFSSIVLQTKKTHLVDNSNLKLDDDSDSIDFTDKFMKKPEIDELQPEIIEIQPEVVEIQTIEIEKEEIEKPEEEKQTQEPLLEIPPALKPVTPPTVIENIPLPHIPLPVEKTMPTEPIKPPETKIKRSRSISPKVIRDKRRSRSRSRDREMKRRSPIRRPSPPSRRRHASPRRRSPMRRRGSPRRRSPSPKRRSLSPRRRSPRRRRRSPSMSPLRRGGARKRTPSPRRRASPLNSPLDGFKKSVADSTISDDMLPQPTSEDYTESPNAYSGKYFERKMPKKLSISPQVSPKRISLDDRISQVLGLEKEAGLPPPPKLQDAYSNYNYNYGQYTQYGQYMQKNDYVQQPHFGPMMYTQPPPIVTKPPPQTPTKVLQVGNILQVVPTEEIPPQVIEKTPDRLQKIVQVGNMLQIVPAIISTPTPAPVPEPLPQPVAKPIPLPEKQSAEAVMKQKAAERKAEREKRRQERERRRKEKEKKRKEKEKRKQMKLKMSRENMIKRAIQLETEALANEDVDEDAENPVQWPQVPLVVISATPTGKGILLQGGSKHRKSVQFADGVRPGEGTSPSGGEELSSPPPRKLPKEKRFKKLKIPKKSKKKKIRVKVIKKVQQEEDNDDEEDNLPPPSPPPGSPPPHVFPSRVKTHTINNVHPYVGNIMQSSAPAFAYRPPMQMVMSRHQPPPGYMQGPYPPDVNNLQHAHPHPHPTYQGVPSHH